MRAVAKWLLRVTRTVWAFAALAGTAGVSARPHAALTPSPVASPSAPLESSAPAGTVADAALLRITGDPATPAFIQEQAALVAEQQSLARRNATVVAAPQAVDVRSALRIDDVTSVDVPVTIAGAGYLTVQGTTHVRVENVALPRLTPSSLLVSEAPEKLTDSEVLFSTDIESESPYRLLYHHSSPPGQPDRRIVLLAQNASREPALVQIITGSAGPEKSEMEAGHLSTRRFLVRLIQNEGTLVTVPGSSAVVLTNQSLPAGDVVSSLMQVLELNGVPLHLILLAQNARDDASRDFTVPSSDRPHAGGEYRSPEFSFERTYEASAEFLTVPIGRIPVPDVHGGRALSGDYGVLQKITLRMVNNDRASAHIALYANPRGGRATGSFLIDRVLVQAHAMEPFTYYKLCEYAVPANGYLTTTIVTMPESGSLYPLNLILAPDDGSISPGAPGSPVY